MAYDFDSIIDRGPQSGTFSLKWQGYASRFPGFDIDEAHTLSMWVADMDFETPSEVKQAIAQRAQHGIYGYVSGDATRDLFEAASGWFARRYGWNGCEAEWMLHAPGVVPALYAAVQAFTQPGEGVIVQPPVYYPFAHAVRDSKRLLVENPLVRRDGRYAMNLEQLEALAALPRTTLLVLCSPHNPVGRVWTPDELEALLDICAAHGVVVVADEIHADLMMPGHAFCTAGRFPQHHDYLVLAHSTSKTFNLAGLESAVITVPNQRLRDRLKAQMRANCLSSGNVFGPIAGTAAWRCGDAFVDALCAYVSDNVQAVRERLAAEAPSLSLAPLEGTYLAWVDFSGLGLTPEDAYRLVLEKARVAGDLGSWFGTGGDGFVRFNLACPRAKVHELCDRLASVM